MITLWIFYGSVLNDDINKYLFYRYSQNIATQRTNMESIFFKNGIKNTTTEKMIDLL